jgi:anti-repressor protein
MEGNIMMDSGNALKVFDFDGRKVRVARIGEEVYFVAKDVAEAVGYTWHRGLMGHIPGEWKGVNRIDTLGGEQEMLCLSEQGLYFFLARSDKPAALPFQKHIAGEILPSIRKYGGYLTDKKLEEALTNPDTIIRLAQNLKAEREKRRMLEAKVNDDHPKVLFAELVEASGSSILIGDLAKLIRQNGIKIGPRRLFEWMRQNGYLMKSGESRNMPTQRAMESGLFKVKERAIDNPDGTILLTRTTKVTGLGQVFFLNLFLYGKNPA